MPLVTVDPELLAVALERVAGRAFEDFVNEFMAGLVGATFVPVGGVADGGADGYIANHLREEVRRSGHYLQTSISEGVPAKVRHTVARLYEVGREAQSLTFCSSRPIANSEALQYNLSTELGLALHLRDRKYIASHINSNNHTRAAYENHLLGLTTFLTHIGASTVLPASSHVENPDAFVFLRQEIDRRKGDSSLVEAVVDSLIIWALEDTDPDEGKFMGRDDIRERILALLPAARPYLDASLDARLEAISSKQHPNGRLIRWHQKEDLFVLPYTTRERTARDNAEDENIKSEAIAMFAHRARDVVGEDPPDAMVQRCANVIRRALEVAFEREGLAFAHFLSHTESGAHYHYLSDAVAAGLNAEGISEADRGVIGDAVMETLRLVFYHSHAVERRYLERLSRTYAILFTLQSEPKLIEYFQEMNSNFYLYVGSDLLIRCLSERYLAPEDQITRNMLRMSAQAGATLVLAEPVLEEVVSHLRGTDREYRNYVQPAEAHVDMHMARHASRILIRSYFYARLAQTDESVPRPSNWDAYINQFCDVADLHRPAALAQLRVYLQAELSLSFESRGELHEVVAMVDVSELAHELSAIKGAPELADNDALMSHAVYGRREALGESSVASEFGFRTWWLTGGETRMLEYTHGLIEKHHGARFIIRPEFLLNFISLSPSAADARSTYSNVFPTLLGIRLARRMDQKAFRGLMGKVEEAGNLESSRRRAKLAQMANALKGDLHRQYDLEFRADRVTSRGEFIQPSIAD